MARLRLASVALALAFQTLAATAAPDARASKFYEDALARYERRDLAGAIIQLKNALQIDKNMLSGRVLLAKALLTNGDPAGAETEFTESLRLGVNRAEVAVPLALAMTKQGKQPLLLELPSLSAAGLPPDVRLELLIIRATAAADIGSMTKAFDELAQARAMAPQNPSVWAAEVPLRIRARQLTEAMAAADQALVLDPKSSMAHYQKGSIHHVAGRNTAAVAAYDQALKLDPNHAEARLARAGILIDLGQIEKARTDVTALLQIAPDEPRSLYLSALIAERTGDTEKASSTLKRITALLDPVPIDMMRYRPQALLLLGLAHYGLNEFEKAKPYLEYAYRLQTNYPLAKLLAQVYMTEPSPGKAEEVLEAHLRSNPGDGQAKLMLASALMAQGRHGRASSLMRDALQARNAPEFRTALGMSLMRSGQSTEAVAELEKGFLRNPGQTYTGIALVTLQLRTGQTVKALATAQQLVKAQPNNPSAFLVLGLARTAAGDLKGAQTAYEQSLKLDASLIEPKIGLARLSILARDLPSAEKRLTEVLKTDEKNIDALLEMAILSEVRQQPGEVLRWLEKALDHSDARELRPGFALAAWHLKQGQAAKALEVAKQLTLRAPEDVRTLHLYADALIANRSLLLAKSVLTEANRKAGYDTDALTATARRQMEIKDWTGARYSVEKALSTNAKDLTASVLMTTIDLQTANLDGADRRARQITLDHPKLAVGYNLQADVAASRRQTPQELELLGRAHTAEPSTATMLRLFRAKTAADGPSKGGLQLLENWLKHQPRDLVIRKTLANARMDSGDLSGARAEFEAALKQNPNDAETLNNLATVMIRQRDPNAVKMAERALAAAPRNAVSLDTAGWAHLQQGDKDRALQLLRDARLREPGNPEIRYHLAAALNMFGRKDEARAELEQALQSQFEFPGIREARALLGTLK